VPTSRATRVTSEANEFNCATMVFTTRAVCRNSPLSERPSTSSAMVCERSPLATEPITRATSVDGCTRSPIRPLTESRHSAHRSDADPRLARWLILPSLPTALLMRANSLAMRSFSLKMSLSVSAILPAIRSGQPAIEPKIAVLEGDQGLQ
jgi:hypothetical protein